MVGPMLREMSHLIHTEYSLIGKWTEKSRQPQEILEKENGESENHNYFKDEMMRMIRAFRMSMFAPTVTGSPMENACRRL